MKPFTLLMPIVVLAAGVGSVVYMNNNQPLPTTRPKAKTPVIEVEVVRVSNGHFQPSLRAQGVVRAWQQTSLYPEVSGKVVRIAEDFAVGKRVKKAQILVYLDTARYSTQVAIARAEVTRAEATLIEEQARAALALDNWKRSGNPGQPGALTRREPQVQAAEANLDIARNRLKSAMLDLAATEVKAPYDGVVIQANANLGQLVSGTSQLGVVMSTDVVEARIPLTSTERALLPPLPLDVELFAQQGETSVAYAGKVVSNEMQVNEQTRQLGLIVEIVQPFEYPIPVLPGQFVIASIPAVGLQDVASLPLAAVTVGGKVSLIEDGLLTSKQVELVLTQQDTAIVRGLADGDLVARIALTNLPNGSQVTPVFAAESR